MPTAQTAGVTVLVTRLSRVVYRRINERLLGMSLKAFVVLSHLKDCGPTSQQELGEVLCLDANNLVLLLNEVEGAGHALRRRDPEDRRRHIVEITPAGLRAVARAERGIESVEEGVLSALDRDERSDLHRLLVRALQGQPAMEDRAF